MTLSLVAVLGEAVPSVGGVLSNFGIPRPRLLKISVATSTASSMASDLCSGVLPKQHLRIAQFRAPELLHKIDYRRQKLAPSPRWCGRRRGDSTVTACSYRLDPTPRPATRILGHKLGDPAKRVLQSIQAVS